MKCLILFLFVGVSVLGFTDDQINKKITEFEKASGFSRSDKLYRIMKSRVEFQQVGRDLTPKAPFEVVKSKDEEGSTLEALVRCFMETQIINTDTSWEDIVHLIPIKKQP